MDELNEKKLPIQGWLILIAVLLWVGTIFSPLDFLTNLLSLRKLISIPITNWIDLVFSVVSSVALIVALVKFTRRRRNFVKWYLGFQILAIIRNTVVLFICLSGIISNNVMIYSAIFGLIENVALIFYVLRSKRVKKTFIR